MIIILLKKFSILLTSIYLTSIYASSSCFFYENFFDGKAQISSYHLERINKYYSQEKLVESFNTYLSENQTPTTSEFKTFLKKEVILNRCRGKLCYKKHLRSILAFLRHKDLIDNQFQKIVLGSFKNNALNLKSYLTSLRSFFKLRNKKIPGHICKKYDLRKLYRSKFKRKIHKKNLNPREYLHLKYNSFQINLMARRFQYILEIMNSPKAYIFVELDNEESNEVIYNLSYTEKYRMGLKFLNLELNKLERNKAFSTRPLKIDLLFAALEAGVIDGELLEQLINYPGLIDNYRNRFKIYKELGLNLGKLVLLSTPGIGQLALIPILILESRESIKTLKKSRSNETHIF